MLVPGGSSGGSAAAVAARLAWARPAPTPAARSASRRRSPASSASSRPMAAARAGASWRSPPRSIRPGRSPHGARRAILLRSMAGHDPKDSTSADVPVPDYEAAMARGVKGMRIGIPREYRIDGMPAEIEALWQQGAEWLKAPAPRSSTCRCRTPNTRCRPITSSRRRRPRPISRAMTACASACACRPHDLARCTRRPAPPGFGAEVRRRIMIGTYVLSAGYYDAYYLRRRRCAR
jgi:aspartyl-tRNA(Asn)/glutamyl-tRNA(Gln) amidotransferase subunit A